MLGREELEQLVTTGRIEVQRNMGKTARKDFGWTNRVVQSRKRDRSAESNEG